MVNLKQIQQATEEDIASGLANWARLFQATTWEEMKMIAENNESMKSFTFSLKQLTEDEKIQMQCEARRRYECDRASLHDQGFREGVEQEKQNTLREQERANIAEEQASIEKQRADAMEAEIHRLKAQLSK